MADFIAKAEKLQEEAKIIRSNEPKWTFLKTQSNVSMFYKPSPHFNGNMYKFTTELDVPYDVVYDVMKPPKTTEERLAWDKSLKNYTCVATFREDVAIGYLSIPSALMGAVSKREFVDLYLFKTFQQDDLNDNYGAISWIFSTSVDHPSQPPSSDYVRGINYPGGYAVAQNKKEPQKSFLELYVNCDVGGMLPRTIVEVALPSQQISFIRSVEAEAKRRCGKA